MLDALAVGAVVLVLETLAQLMLFVLEPFAALGIEAAFAALEALLRHRAECGRGNSCDEHAKEHASMHRSSPLQFRFSRWFKHPEIAIVRPRASAGFPMTHLRSGGLASERLPP